MDEVIVKFKARVIFRQYIPKKRKKVSASKFTNSVMNQGVHDMRVYLGRDSHSTTDGM